MGACLTPSYGANYIDQRSIAWSDAQDYESKQSLKQKQESKNEEDDNILKVMSWNVAGINNNPWEYYVNLDDDNYNALMHHIECFLTDTGKQIKVQSVLDSIDTNFMSKISNLLMTKCKLSHDKFSALMEEEKLSTHLSMNICDFLSNKWIGEQRLISWPDRLLNTIDDANGSYLYRPAVINYYQKRFESAAHWFQLWIAFMDDIGIDILTQNEKNKYAAKYAGGSRTFLLLNIIFLAIFDGILVFMLFDIERQQGIDWQRIKQTLYKILNKDKMNRTAQIINNQYAEMDVLFLQEVRNNLMGNDDALKEFAHRFDIIYPQQMSKNNQTSVICLRKDKFGQNVQKVTDVSAVFYKELEKQTLIGEGDLICLVVADYILISFHADSGGMASADLMSAIHRVQQSKEYGDKKLVIGMDANTHSDNVSDNKKKYSVSAFDALLKRLSFCTCFYGQMPNNLKHTVNSARTYLQPQLNKAVKREDITKQNVDFRAAKDYIVFADKQFDAKKGCTVVDNQGNGKYEEKLEYVIPSQQFPSDHAIISAHLIRK